MTVPVEMVACVICGGLCHPDSISFHVGACALTMRRLRKPFCGVDGGIETPMTALECEGCRAAFTGVASYGSHLLECDKFLALCYARMLTQ